MKDCINCGRQSEDLYGPMADLCETCNRTFGHALDPQDPVELNNDLNVDDMPFR